MKRLPLICLFFGPLLADEPAPSIRKTRVSYLRQLRSELLDPGAAAGALIGAAFDQNGREPPEWGQGAAGYGRRVASGLGQYTVDRTVAVSVAAALHLEARYHRSGVTGAPQRIRHAIFAAILSDTAGGGRTLNVPALAGACGGGMAMLAWYPDRYSVKDGLRFSVGRMGGVAIGNLFTEFWPDIKRIVLRRPRPQEP